MKKALFAALILVGGCMSQPGAQFTAAEAALTTGPAPGQAVDHGVLLTQAWMRFPGPYHRILQAKTPAEFEWAVNHHPLSGPKYHEVAGGFAAFQNLGPSPDCAVDDTAPNNMSSAIVYVDGTDHTKDRIYTYDQIGGTDELVAFDDTCATVWSQPLYGAIDGALGGDDTYLAAVEEGGILDIFTLDGTPITTALMIGTTTWMTPWVQNESGTHAFYFGDESGYLYKIIVSGGVASESWGLQPNGSSPIHSSPSIYNGFLYTADDAGKMFVYDLNGNQKAVTNVYSGTFYNTNADRVYSSVTVDIAGNHFYNMTGNKVFEFTLDATNGCSLSGSACAVTHSAPMGTSKYINANNVFFQFEGGSSIVYAVTAYAGKLYRFSTDLQTSNNIAVHSGTVTPNVSRFGLTPTFSSPMSTPVEVGPDASGNYYNVVGDDDGNVDRITSPPSFGTMSVAKSQNAWTDGTTTRTCATVDSMIFSGSTGTTQWGYFHCGLSGGTSSALIQMDPLNF